MIKYKVIYVVRPQLDSEQKELIVYQGFDENEARTRFETAQKKLKKCDFVKLCADGQMVAQRAATFQDPDWF